MGGYKMDSKESIFVYMKKNNQEFTQINFKEVKDRKSEHRLNQVFDLLFEKIEENLMKEKKCQRQLVEKQ